MFNNYLEKMHFLISRQIESSLHLLTQVKSVERMYTILINIFYSDAIYLF